MRKYTDEQFINAVKNNFTISDVLNELKLNNDNQISFFTSDKTGNFEIVLEGFTEDGIPISVKNYFEVK